jgi:glucose-6-phosphate 1-dehydrogenase
VTETQAPPVAEENPLLEGLRRRRTAEPCVLTIFGASGDLTQRKLFPALYALAVRHLLPEHFAVLGVARSEMTTDEFRERMREATQENCRDTFNEEIWDGLAEGVRYLAMDFSDEAGWEDLARSLSELDEERKTEGNRVFYLAVPPDAFEGIVTHLGARRSTEGWTRLICEKPFGHDLESAKQLNAAIREYFAEEEVFRIDHYLGKETVQNMLVLRFANGIFEPIWNRQFVDHVQITVAATSSRTTCSS